jgi:hypothetical protein
MTLPKLNTPEYELELPSTKETVKYRPYLVKEEKLLMIAMETGEEKDVINATIQAVDNCTFNKFKVDTMPSFDVEYLLLNIRAKSTGEVSELNVLCTDDYETYAPAKVDLKDVKVQYNDEHNKTIKLTDEIGVVMGYPSVTSTFSSATGTEFAFALIRECIEQVYDKDSIYNRADMSEEEIDEFIDSMDTSMLEKVQSFFSTSPVLKHSIKVTNPKTKVECDIELRGLQSFFG